MLAYGPGALLSHTSALALWELRDEGARTARHISVPTQSGRRGQLGILLHRAATLTVADATRRRGIPVTTLARTLIDVAPILGERDLKAAIREAEYRHGLDIGLLRRGLEGSGRSPKRGRLRRTLDLWVPGIGLTRSELEASFLELCGSGGLSLPRPQARVGDYRPDFLWADIRLVVEVDGYGAHRGRVAFQDDRARDRTKAAGYEVLRFTWAEVVGRPRPVAAELRAALAPRAREAAR